MIHEIIHPAAIVLKVVKWPILVTLKSSPLNVGHGHGYYSLLPNLLKNRAMRITLMSILLLRTHSVSRKLLVSSDSLYLGQIKSFKHLQAQDGIVVVR